MLAYQTKEGAARKEAAHAYLAGLIYRGKVRIRSPEQVKKRREAARLAMRRLYGLRRAQRLAIQAQSGETPSIPKTDMA